MKNHNLYYLSIVESIDDSPQNDVQKVRVELSRDSAIIAYGSMDNPLRSDTEYSCLFIEAPYAFRRAQYDKAISKIASSNLQDVVSNPALADTYLEAAELLKYAIREISPSVDVLCNLSFGDFCILDTDKSFQSSTIKQSAHYFFQNYSWSDEESANVLQTLNKQILKRFTTQFLYKRNPYYAEYADVLSKLMVLPCGNNDRSMECSLLAALLLRTMLDETAVRWVNTSGDLYYDEPEMSHALDAAHARLMRGLHLFLDQAPFNQVYSNQIWSLIFVTRALLASIIGRAERDAFNWDALEDQNAAEQETILERFNSFYGFLPIIEPEAAEVSSYFTENHSPDYHFAFLTVPHRFVGQFWSFFPACVHEFYHYISPIDRRSRNNIILKLTLYAILNPIYSITEDSPVDLTVYQQFVELIFDCIECLRSDLFHPTDECSENKFYQMETSMKYIDLMRGLLPTLDFSLFYDYAVHKILAEHADAPQLKSILSVSKAKCLALWNDNAVDFAQTFAVALKEIRADIAMCHFLDLNLDNYIKIMALEHSFASLPAQRTADSVFLRFGFMTRYLFFSKSDSFSYTSSALRKWKDTCLKSIASLSENEIEDLEEKQNNLRAYLEEYEEITVDSESEKHVIVIFESMLLTAENEEPSFVDSWERRLNRHKEHAFVQDLKELYNHYINQTDTREQLLFEYQTRLVFRDLFEHFSDIDRC